MTSEDFLSKDQIIQLPKVELHKHLEGSIRLETLIELGKIQLKNFPQDLKEQKDYFLIQKPMESLSAVIDCFINTQQLLNSQEILERITYECIEDAYLQGIKLLELRYAPSFIQMGHEHLSFQQIHDAILRGQKRAEEKYDIATGFIGIIVRTMDYSEAEKSTQFFIDNKESFIAMDLADKEVGFNCKSFSPLFKKAKEEGLYITVHSGEENVAEGPQNILDAIEYLHADRIGHGLQCVKDKACMEVLKSEKIMLELCPISNWITNAVSSKGQHPFAQIDQFGIPVSINSDDPGVFGSDINDEYLLLQDYFGYGKKQFQRINRQAFRKSFINESKKMKFEKDFAVKY